MKCVACGKEGTKKDLLFTEDKQLYCANPFSCNEHHPNSVQNIVKRAGAVRMFNEEELEQNTFENLNVSPEMKDRIIKAVSKPQSIRLSKYEIAHYLLELQDKRGLNSISEAVRYCVSLAMKVSPIDAADEGLDVPADEYESSEQVEPFDKSIGVENGIKFTVPDIPKSVNVDWSQVKTEAPKKKIDKPVPAEEPEEEFEF